MVLLFIISKCVFVSDSAETWTASRDVTSDLLFISDTQHTSQGNNPPPPESSKTCLNENCKAQACIISCIILICFAVLFANYHGSYTENVDLAQAVSFDNDVYPLLFDLQEIADLHGG